MSAKEQPTKFVILTTQRSGSTWLVSVMNQLENVTVYGELFLDRKKRSGKENLGDNFTYARFVETKPTGIPFRPFSTFSYLDKLYEGPRTVGFKLMYTHLAKHPELMAYFLWHRVKIIHLVRRNLLDMLISQAIKRQLRRSHILEGQEKPDTVRVRLKSDTLIQKLEVKEKKLARARRMVQWSGLPAIEVAYENLQENPQEITALCEFLEVPLVHEIPSSKLVKMRKGSPSEVLENFHEISQLLVSTPYAAFLEENVIVRTT